jgi:pyoverdine/dityrosine biosynthesis protein Dit1
MLSNTITIVPSIEARIVEPLQPFDTSRRVSFPATLPLDTLAWARKKAANEALVERIAEIIASYRISGPEDLYEDVYKPKLLETLRYFVSKQDPINMVVPAYPFKSPNRKEKVLGPDPDVGERMSLEHFNSMGARIRQIYPPGGHVTIVSDGCCYNDLLGVSDEEVFRYAEGLHRIVDRLGLKHIRFSDPFELIEGRHNVPITEEEYASRIGELKDRLFSSYLPAGYDFDEDLKKDPNAALTYRGYIRFLMSDLALLFKDKQMSKNAIKKHCSTVARGMIERGKAFSALVAKTSPLHVRLSIHASDNTGKLSVALLPHKRYSTFPVTPWHNTPYLDTESVSLSLSRKPTDGAIPYRLFQDELGLNFLCADVPMYRVIETPDVPALTPNVQFQPLYPFGLRIRVPRDTPISQFRLEHVVELAKVHSPVIFEGLDPMQYTTSMADDFRRVAGGALSLSILHEGVATTTPATRNQGETAAASYFVQISAATGDDAQPALLPFIEAAAALDDVRYRVLHRWQAGHAVVTDHRVALAVHLSPSSLRVLRGGV